MCCALTSVSWLVPSSNVSKVRLRDRATSSKVVMKKGWGGGCRGGGGGGVQNACLVEPRGRVLD